MATRDANRIIDDRIRRMQAQRDAQALRAKGILREQGPGREFDEASRELARQDSELRAYRKAVHDNRVERYIEKSNVERFSVDRKRDDGSTEYSVLTQDELAMKAAAREHGTDSPAYRNACQTRREHEQEYLRARQAMETRETSLQKMANEAQNEEKSRSK